MAKCPNCKREIAKNAKICSYCGVLLAEYYATHMLEKPDYEEGVPKWGTARFGSRMKLILTVQDTDINFVFDANALEEVVMGRRNLDTSEIPEVDLLDYEGVEKGVSRRHAAIIFKDGSLQVMDLGSPNGTYLNGQRLVANQARVLRDGDDIRLGHLVLRVRFERE